MTKTNKNRIPWEQYFMNIAHEVATRSTCERKHVGGDLSGCQKTLQQLSEKIDPLSCSYYGLRKHLYRNLHTEL